ncbi:hypothetical protein F7725_014144 [Dissostichus mawsoni]|uniref:Ankyrin repeat and SAM domain-containing protein 3 n=1 Tax=Dissostichus mawsoni TaxID=36200 RepID=A0A7J5YVK3_DISMA|nr:hypothetical protein F7725_014144 [Dissostichus mawsoni]
MSELSDEASESDQLGASLSMWLGDFLVRPEELDVPLDLHTACSIGQYDVVSGREVDLNGKNIGGWTPLMYASYIGHDNIANLLLEAGVNVNAMTAKGLTPLMLAASCGNESIAYFLLQHGAELELKDTRGWTALFHCTSTGHQQMVRFLLDNNADANVKEPLSGFTTLMEAAASGHEIIVQYLLDHKVKIDERNSKGETARALAMLYGYTKIVSLIDSRSPRIKPGHFEDLSSSEDSDSAPPRVRPSRTRAKGVSIHDGPKAIDKFRVGGSSKLCGKPPAAAPGYMALGDIGEQSDGICYRDVTSPINELDGQSNSSRDDSPFLDNDMPTMKSSSSSEGLPHVVGLSWEGSVESNETVWTKATDGLGDSEVAQQRPPPGDALEQAYADKLEAEMQEMAIQLHKHCEEAESLQSQVSQEKELRTVMEGCLMEDKMAWSRVHGELVENHRLSQEMNATLARTRACSADLLVCIAADSSYRGVEDQTKGDNGVKGEFNGEGLTRSAVAELLKKLDSHEEELAGTLQTVLQSLRRLSAPEKVSDSWERP